MSKAPTLGSYITHHEPVFATTHRGIVAKLLSSQFAYVTEDGDRRLCLNNEDWEPVKLKKRDPNDKIIAPSVWRGDFEAPTKVAGHDRTRTCIVCKVTKKGFVQFIPTTGDVFELYELSDSEFRERYIDEIDYPPERAARLYVEHTRSFGATDEALGHLKALTNLTPEEIEMAKAKTKVPASKSSISKGKAPAKSKAKAPAKTKPKAKAAPKAKADKKPRGPSPASVFMELIMEKGTGGECKHSDDQIFAKVQKKFGLDDNKRSYVSWYRNKLKKDGSKPPTRKGGEASRGRPKADAKAKSKAKAK